MSKPILCLDFDGVIHSYASGWKGEDNIPDEPTLGAMKFIVEAVNHFDIAIFSTRSKSTQGIDAMRRWVRYWLHGYLSSLVIFPGAEGGLIPAIRAVEACISYPTEKPLAFVTLDDRAITFEGVWPSVESLLNFKPWYKRESEAKSAATGTG